MAGKQPFPGGGLRPWIPPLDTSRNYDRALRAAAGCTFGALPRTALTHARPDGRRKQPLREPQAPWHDSCFRFWDTRRGPRDSSRIMQALNPETSWLESLARPARAPLLQPAVRACACSAISSRTATRRRLFPGATGSPLRACSTGGIARPLEKVIEGPDHLRVIARDARDLTGRALQSSNPGHTSAATRTANPCARRRTSLTSCSRLRTADTHPVSTLAKRCPEP